MELSPEAAGKDEALLESALPPRRSQGARGWARACAVALIAGTVGALSLALAAFVRGGAPGAPSRLASAADPPKYPYLYVSFHGNHRLHPKARQGVNQVLRYRLDGGSRHDRPLAVLGPMADGEMPRELRGMYHDPASGDLFVANAYVGDSQILRYGQCGRDGKRQFAERIAPRTDSGAALLLHPYGLAMMRDILYTTTQDSGSVLGYNVTVRSRGSAGWSPTVFSSILGARVPPARVAFRGIAAHEGEGCLFIAEEVSGAVHPLCRGRPRAPIPLDKPIAVVVDAPSGLLVAGSRAKRNAHVAAFNVSTGERVRAFRHRHLKHPAGLAIDGHRLYVAAQRRQAILEFDLRTGKFTRVVADHLPDWPEWITLSSC